MKQWLYGIASASLLGFSTATLAETEELAATTNDSATFAERAELVADGFVRTIMKEHDVPALTLAIVKDGEVAVLKGYGHADLKTQQPVDPSRHLFRIGSTSKTFTWTAIMQLVEQGKLDLNASINTYLKSYQVPEPFGKLTLHHLMSHRTGFEEVGEGMHLERAEDIVSLQEFVRTFVPEMAYAPGERTAYSNYGVALAGLIVQEVSGQRFDEYVAEHIFQPLGMSSTTFREPFDKHPTEPAMAPALAENVVTSYVSAGGVHYPFPLRYLTPTAPAGSGFSTAEDMANYMMAHLNNGELNGQRILQSATVEQMRERHFNDRSAMTDFAHGFFNGHTNGYDYFGHGGATATFRTVMDFYPELGFGVYASVNQVPGGSLLIDLPGLLVNELFPPKAVKTRPVANPEFAQQAPKFAGYYEGNRRAFASLERISGLFGSDIQVSVDGQGHLLITAGGKTTAYVETGPLFFEPLNGGEPIQFEADADGNILRYSVWRANSYDKVGYVSTRAFFKLALVLTLLFSLFTLLGAWRRRAISTSVSTWHSRLAVLVAVGAFAWLLLMFVAFTGIVLTDAVVLVWASAIFSLLLILLALSVPSAWFASSWGAIRKLHHTLYAVVGVLMVIALWQWNLLSLF